jgi:CD109 antigen
MNVKVSARHTFGKPIKGLFKITATSKTNPNRKILRGGLNVTDLEDFEINFTELDVKEEDDKAIININVEFEEALTGRKQNASAEVQVHENLYNIEIRRLSRYFKPKEWIEYFVKILDHDGNPIIEKDKNITIQIRYEDVYSGFKQPEPVSILNKNEENYHSFEVTSFTGSQVNIKVIFNVYILDRNEK